MSGKGLGLLALGMFGFILLYSMLGQLYVQNSVAEYNRAKEHSRSLGFSR